MKAREGRRSATSDWMEMEKARGISITSAAVQFEHEVAPSPEKVQSALVRHNMVVFSNGERALQASAQFGAIPSQFCAIRAQLL